MANEGTLISARGISDGYHPSTMVDVQLKLTAEQASDLDVEIRRQLLLLELKDV